MQTRARIAFLFLFVVMIALSVGAYRFNSLGLFLGDLSAHQREASSPGPSGQPSDPAPRQRPSGKLLQMITMAGKAADETSAAAEKLSAEIAPPALARDLNLATASRSELEALRGDLKLAEANAAASLPRYAALIKTERDSLEAFALSLRADKASVGTFLDGVDQRHAELTALTGRLFSARADYYRAYERYVAVLAGEFGSYQVVSGKFIFPLQRTVDRYNVAAQAMADAARRVAEAEDEKARLLQTQQQEWQQLANGK
jgi:hypothetical protein